MTSASKKAKKAEAGREPASLLLIELRRALGMSQAEFAIKLMDVAPITVYRLETTTPPRGDVLLQLADIAGKAIDELFDDDETGASKLQDIRDRLLGMFLEEVIKRIGIPFTHVLKGDRPHHGFLTMRLDDIESLKAAYSLVIALAALHSDDASISRLAKKILSGFNRAVGRKLPVPAELEFTSKNTLLS
jgi:transcriptional regulator with XRE-family HTH domain